VIFNWPYFFRTGLDFSVLMSLDLSWQALHNSGLATTYGNGDFGSLEINFSIFGILFHMKSWKLISPSYNASFKCHLHLWSCGEGGYHFGRFQPNW